MLVEIAPALGAVAHLIVKWTHILGQDKALKAAMETNLKLVRMRIIPEKQESACQADSKCKIRYSSSNQVPPSDLGGSFCRHSGSTDSRRVDPDVSPSVDHCACTLTGYLTNGAPLAAQPQPHVPAVPVLQALMVPGKYEKQDRTVPGR